MKLSNSETAAILIQRLRVDIDAALKAIDTAPDLHTVAKIYHDTGDIVTNIAAQIDSIFGVDNKEEKESS